MKLWRVKQGKWHWVEACCRSQLITKPVETRESRLEAFLKTELCEECGQKSGHSRNNNKDKLVQRVWKNLFATDDELQAAILETIEKRYGGSTPVLSSFPEKTEVCVSFTVAGRTHVITGWNYREVLNKLHRKSFKQLYAPGYQTGPGVIRERGRR